MSNSIENLSEWVNSSKVSEREEREAIHILLHAIASDENLSSMFALKGGQLMRLMHSSPRYTRDLDFSNSESIEDGDEDPCWIRSTGLTANARVTP